MKDWNTENERTYVNEKQNDEKPTINYAKKVKRIKVWWKSINRKQNSENKPKIYNKRKKWCKINEKVFGWKKKRLRNKRI